MVGGLHKWYWRMDNGWTCCATAARRFGYTYGVPLPDDARSDDVFIFHLAGPSSTAHVGIAGSDPTRLSADGDGGEAFGRAKRRSATSVASAAAFAMRRCLSAGVRDDAGARGVPATVTVTSDDLRPAECWRRDEASWSSATFCPRALMLALTSDGPDESRSRVNDLSRPISRARHASNETTVWSTSVV